MLDADLLPLLRCPATHQPLRPATAAEKQVHGLPPGSEALASEDGTRVYGVAEGLLFLLSANEVAEEG